VIDVHAHVVLEATLGAAGAHGPELDEGDEAAGRPPCFRVGGFVLEGVRYRGTAFMDLDVRLARMDEFGIDLQVLSPNPLTYFHHIDADAAASFCRSHNDAMADLVAAEPARLAGLAQLPLQDPEQAAGELRRAVTELGLLGAYVGTDPGRTLDDAGLDVVYAACTELDVPLFVHPAPAGIDGPTRDERLRRFDADLWLGFAYEESLAVAALVLGGVLTRHPDLDVCVSHGGGATSWLAERMAHAARTRPWADADLRREGEVEARLGRLWWDAHVGGPDALAGLLRAFGSDRLVAGTNLAGWDAVTDPSEGDAALAATMDANACRLLRLDRGNRRGRPARG
jgi:aminocarboxymuconate-semialdehyde decarboxylase